MIWIIVLFVLCIGVIAADRPHPNDEVCNVMGPDPHPCTPEQRALLYVAHEHDSAGNLVLMTKGPKGEIVRTTVAKKDWLAKKKLEMQAAQKSVVSDPLKQPAK